MSSRSSAIFAAVAVVVLSTLFGCGKSGPGPGKAVAYNTIGRESFNQRAVELNLPLFWREDANGNGILDPAELAVLTGLPRGERSHWIDANGALTPAFADSYREMGKPDIAPADPAEAKRHSLVLQELSQGGATLVETDLTKASAADKNLAAHMVEIARLIERIFARQKGVLGMDDRIPASDTASRALFHRNQSPFCEAPKTESDPACNAFASPPPRVVGLYPADIQSDPKFCDMLGKAPNAADLMGHFVVVDKGEKAGAFRTIGYNEAYREDMENVAKELEAAANGLDSDEAALKNYLLADAASFRSNDWEPANVAWVAMNAQNSKWYARIAPDEVYYEPCAWKAGFALQLAHINPDSLEWQKKLDPLKREMENTLAGMAGKPYAARDVQFKIPDFIDVVLNAGDQRSPSGATIGQSLPNWGPVAEKGGRTVAMTNLYTDADSRSHIATQMSSMFCKATNALATTGPHETLVSSVLHEAAHNLGPAHEYKVNGKVDSVIFGGPMASTLEELKAQTSAMYLTQWLIGKGIFTDEEAQKVQLRNVAWMFGHISRGMYAGDGTPRNYSQLAAMQLGSFVKSHAISWHADEVAANGTDKGCLQIDFKALPAAIQSFETTVLKIKGSGDRAGAEKLKQQFVDGKDDFAALKSTLSERWLRAPKASFVYSVYW